MFYAYGASIQGAYHIKSGVVCQDSHKIIKPKENIVIAAVADGLGSEIYTDVASKMAAETATEYCAMNIKAGDKCEDILDAIRTSFMVSQRSIEKAAKDAGNDIDQYDTTLSLAVIIGDALYFGQSGDSGILAMATDGAFYQVTEQQRDEMGRVFPLAFDERWVFQKYDRPVASVLLATDGMLETFFPIYIRNEEVNIHVPLARFFMDNELLHMDENGEEAVQSKMEEFINNIDPKQVGDDKTIVAVINDSVEVARQPEEYYAEPDWDALKEKYDREWRRQAYPDLFEEEGQGGQETVEQDGEQYIPDVEMECIKSNIVDRELQVMHEWVKGFRKKRFGLDA